MANEESAELPEPCVGSFDDPSAFVPSELSSVFISTKLTVLAIWNDEFDPSLFESLTQRVGVVGAVGYHPFRLLPRSAFGAGDFDLGERGFRKRNFSRRGTFQPNSHGRPPPSTSTIHFVPLPHLVLQTAEPPFWPERSCRPGTSPPTSGALRRRAHPAVFATHRATHPALPIASAVASK
jgi:hypothetical protein